MEKIQPVIPRRIKILLFSLVSFYTVSTNVEARSPVHHTHKRIHKKANVHKVSATHHTRNSHFRTRTYKFKHKSYGHVIQCVAFARSASDIQLKGNARDWWNNAEGVYKRGNTPEANSVLSFRPTRRMPLGHVAVVKQVLDSRTIIIDQSHWAQRGISHNTPVIDVSANNDWSAVRVALNGNKNAFGSIYPTHGFIYPSTQETTHPIIRENTKGNIRTWTADAATAKTTTEVALAPNISDSDLFGSDAPNRSLK